jgi:hypothetical protein
MMSDTIFKPIYLVETLGEYARIPDGGIISIGGIVSPNFTINGKAIRFADGSSSGDTDTPEPTNATLQDIYNNSNGIINLTAGKNFILNGVNGSKLTFHADTGITEVSSLIVGKADQFQVKDGDVTLSGTINGVDVQELEVELNDLKQTVSDHEDLTSNEIKHHAGQISVDDSKTSPIVGSNVQEAFESIASQLGKVTVLENVISYEHVQDTSQDVWTIFHNKKSDRVQVTVWDEGNEMLFSDSVFIFDENTVIVKFNTPIKGRVILMIHVNNLA